MTAPRKPRRRGRRGADAAAGAVVDAEVWTKGDVEPDRQREGQNESTKDLITEKRKLTDLSVDDGRLSAVDTLAVGVSVRIPVGASAVPSAMDKEHFGNCLRRAREKRDISLSDVAQKTKVSRSVLELLERGDLEALPAGVYSRGFIRSFARAVGTDEAEPLLLYQRAVDARTAAEKAKLTTPVPDAPELMAHQTDDETSAPRRGLGLAVFVIILLLIATITLSLLLRRPPPSGEGLSLRRPAMPLPAAQGSASAVPVAGPPAIDS